MTLEDKVQSLRLHALQRAQQLGNVSAACRELGISRTVFYRWRSQLAKYGVDGLHPKRRSANRGRPHSLSVQDEQAILALAVGYLKGVGKVWQITACDTACSYAIARILPANNAREAGQFLRDLAISFQEAGWPIKRVLTDRGSEFKAGFDLACEDLDIIHTRTKPRHAWTNGFVERLQSTILHEHWRIDFRRRYFTTTKQLEISLQRFLRYYNDERPHFGYRTKGRTPSEIFWGAQRRNKKC